MKLATTFTNRIFAYLLMRVATKRKPDFVVGVDSPEGPYLLRWYITPWRAWYRNVPEDQRTSWQRFAVRLSRVLPNLYLHCFLRDDDDRALHDHPSWAVSWILQRGYIEHTIAKGGIHHRQELVPGYIRIMTTRHTHRIELHKAVVRYPTREEQHPIPCWTLFLFGPTVREWGFHCPEKGWVHWRHFTAAGKPGEIGPGCGE